MQKNYNKDLPVSKVLSVTEKAGVHYFCQTFPLIILYWQAKFPTRPKCLISYTFCLLLVSSGSFSYIARLNIVLITKLGKYVKKNF